jgi:hypothetical protein
VIEENAGNGNCKRDWGAMQRRGQARFPNLELILVDLMFAGETLSAEQPSEEEKLSGQEGEFARCLANVSRKAPGIQDCRLRHEWETQ